MLDLANRIYQMRISFDDASFSNELNICFENQVNVWEKLFIENSFDYTA